MADTALTIVTDALREIRVLGANETPDAEQSAHALSALNSMLDGWSIEGVMTFLQQEESFAITGGDGSYTIGTGGDFATARPNRILQAWVRDANGHDTELAVWGSQRYGSIAVKGQQGLASVLSYYPNYPLGTIRLANVPQQSATLFIVTDKALTQFDNLATAFSFPPGYKRALVKNLAVDLASSYGKAPKDELKETAISSKDAVRRMNLPEVVMTYDGPGRGGRFNIYTGGYT